MTQPAPTFTARRNDIVVEVVVHEVLIYDRRADVAHCLSEVAALVWRRCEHGATLDEIAAQIIAGDLAGSSDATELAESAVSELVEKGLLETSTVGASRVSRRQALRRMAGVGAAAVVAPLVVSATVPSSAAAAASCAGLGVGCLSANSLSNCCSGLYYCNSSKVCTNCLPNGEGSPCTAGTAYRCCSGICNTSADSPHCVSSGGD